MKEALSAQNIEAVLERAKEQCTRKGDHPTGAYMTKATLRRICTTDTLKDKYKDILENNYPEHTVILVTS